MDRIMDRITDDVKICSCLISKPFYPDNLDGLYKATDDHIKDGVFKLVKIEPKENYYIPEEKEGQHPLVVNRKALINSLVNCINFFEKEKAVLIEEQYLMIDSYGGNNNGYDPVDRYSSQTIINYVKILHKGREVFWLSTQNSTSSKCTSSTHLSESTEYTECNNIDSHVALYDLNFMGSFDTLRSLFKYFPLLYYFIIQFISKHKSEVTDDDIKILLALELKVDYKDLSVNKILEIIENKAFKIKKNDDIKILKYKRAR
ncbi:MAG: hypothetical protein PHQ89_01575 [Bacilli bacterium]|nr:hypothetical protein [Bacilli bacterium]